MFFEFYVYFFKRILFYFKGKIVDLYKDFINVYFQVVFNSKNWENIQFQQKSS